MSITYPVYLPVPIKSDRFGLNINKSQFSGEFTRNRITQSHGAGTTDRWEGVYTTPVLSPDQHRKMSAWLTAMSADAGTFYAFNPNGRTLLGNHDGENLLGTDAEAEQSTTTGIAHTYIGPLAVGTLLLSLGLKVGDVISFTSQCKSSTGADDIRMDLQFFDQDGVNIGSGGVSNIVSSATYAAATKLNVTVPTDAVALQLFTRNLTETETGFSKEAIITKSATLPTFVSYLKVDGASQTGTTINIKDGAISTKGLLSAGTMVQIESQLYEVAERVDTDGSGDAIAEIRPAIRTAHPDSEPILVKNPVCIAEIVKTDHPQETNHNSTGIISFAWQEVI